MLFHYVPMYGAIIAFKDFNVRRGIMGSDWVGVKNFLEFFGHPSFWPVIRNTITISLYKIAFGFPAPIILALLFNEIRTGAFKRTIQTISYMPHFLSWVVISGLVFDFLSPSTGIVNGFIKSLGQEPVYFMANPQYFRGILVISDIWKEIGWGSIIYVAAISGINTEMYEAAIVDGAGKMRQMWNITLPSIIPTIVVMLVLRIGGILNAGFEQVFMMYTPNVYAVSDIIDTLVYRLGMESAKFSLATAAGLFKSVISFVLIVLANKIANKLDDSSGIW